MSQRATAGLGRDEALRGGSALLTPHGAGDYPGLDVFEVPSWTVRVIAVHEGQTVEARGGETLHAYELPGGVRAEGFILRAGDRATQVRSGLPHSLVEWRIRRAEPGHEAARASG